ncbi:MAG: NAD(P)-dependent oxidoreductase [Coriobacteriia bacterium]|nr:NAD(P)-dependent oxidoreductase [Coriobacteriia bacterium]
MIDSRSTIGFVGTGVMGASMAGHLMRAGYALRVHNRTPARAAALMEAGAVWCDTPGEVANGADAVITIVGYPADVEEVYLAVDGLVATAAPGTVLIDMTTSSPVLAARIAQEASTRGVEALDAPVSGGDIGAREARLTIMVGGEPEVFESAKPLLQAMGPNVVLQGGPGAGQHTKMCNQIAIAGAMLGAVESLAYARAAGLDPARVLESITAGSAASWSLANLVPRMIAGDMAPGFYVRHFIKDMGIALGSARQMGLDLPGLSLADSLYRRLAEEGGADLGTQALIELYSQGRAASA